MSVTDTAEGRLHKVKVKLYPNNLPGAEGKYTARVRNEASLSIENVAAAMKERGGFTGNYNDLVMHVKLFFDEMAYQLCDGFAVDTGYFSIHPNVGGLFSTAHEDAGGKGHPISFSFHARPLLRNLARHITVEAEEGKAGGIVERFTDFEGGAVNATVTPGGLFSISGARIKVKGDNPECGVYFVSEEDGGMRYKAPGPLAVNTNLKVMGKAPALPRGTYHIEIKTQFTIGGIDLKEPRTVTGAFTLNAG
jgi:hypothetical protein